MKKHQILGGLTLMLLMSLAPSLGEAESFDGAFASQVPKPVRPHGLRESRQQPERTSGQRDAGTLEIVNQYGGGVYYLMIQPGSGRGPVRVPSRAEPVKRIEEGKMYGSTPVIADGASKSYSLEEGSYHVLLNFHKPGRGVFTGTQPPIVITAGQTRTLTITADGSLKY